MAEKRHQPIVLRRVHRRRPGAQAAGEFEKTFNRGGLSVGLRREYPWSPLEEIRPGEPESTALGAADRMSANEWSGAAKRRRSLDDVTFGAPDVGHDRRGRQLLRDFPEQCDVLPYRSREHDEGQLSEVRCRVPPPIDGAAPLRMREHRFPIDAGDPHRGPSLADAKRNRP